MSRIPHPRRLRRNAIIGVAAATFLATASLAVAQINGPPDGSPGGAQQPNLTTLRCGPLAEQHHQDPERAEHDERGQLRPAPRRGHPGRRAAGPGRCVKVLFTAETACGLSGAADFCYIRALDGAIRAGPRTATNFQTMDSEDGSAAGHAYEWVGHLDPGAHNIRIERRVGNNATSFWTDDWTFDVEVHL